MEFSALQQKIDYLSEADKKLVKKAFEVAQKAHQNQKRKTGEPFVVHELETAAFIAGLKLDGPAIAAALLHDVCEDTTCNLNTIRKEFGREIAALVDGVTKLGTIRITRRWLIIKDEKELKEFDRQVETLRKMFVAMAKDIRVILIKLADRLHNMKTLEAIEPEKRSRIAKETLEIYAPLAYRLGMGELKGQLEDWAFFYLYPQEHAALKAQIADKLPAKEKYLKTLKKMLLKKLGKAGIRAEIHGRTKHLYSLYRKLQKHDNDINRIYDLAALRIIVGTVDECYKTLGLIHAVFKPLVGRIKDYIALPKPNSYQSLHTTVFAPKGEIVEIQIRTKQMHDQAENGIAAHWHYSDKKFGWENILKNIQRVPKKELVWVRELSQWQKKLADNKEVAQALTFDFFSDRIFIYTPRGDVKNLPLGATPIDFAYSVHTDLGDRVCGAKINGKLTDLAHELQNGDIVEILTKPKLKPKQDWLGFVKTSLARSKIKAALKLPS